MRIRWRTMTTAAPIRVKRRRSRACLFLPAGLLGAGLLAGLLACALLPAIGRWLVVPGGAAGLRVVIGAPVSGAHVPANRSRVVLIQAHEAAGITRYELWVDGVLLQVQEPDATRTALPTLAPMPWVPAPGTHVLVARAVDAAGRVGISAPVVVEAVPTAKTGPVELGVTARPGDTLPALAAAFELPVETVRAANPGLPDPPSPGEQVVVPVPRDRLPPGYTGDDEGGNGAPPNALPYTSPDAAPEGPPPQGEGEGVATLVDDAAPQLLPGGLAWGTGAPAPPAPPAALQLSPIGGCGAQLRWTDNSDGETGFRVYRYAGGAAGFRAVAELGTNAEFATLVYEDQVPLGGRYQYYVAAVNAAGEAPGPLAAIDLPGEGCALQAPLASGSAMSLLQFEALSLHTGQQFDGVHCYLALARLGPHRRIPENVDSFFRPADGGWNIGVHAAGINRIVFGQPPAEPVAVALECWGTRGRETAPLGAFSASHPREDWDGRDLTAAAEGFRVTYRIQPFANLPPFREVSLDLGIPAPTNVHQPESQADCLNGHTEMPGANEAGQREAWAGRLACLTVDPWQLMVWDWAPNADTPRSEIDGFRIWINHDRLGVHGSDGHQWSVLGEVSAATQVFPVPRPPCDTDSVIEVEAFVAGPPARESSRDNGPFAAVVSGPDCPRPTGAVVEFTLDNLIVSDVTDKDGLEYLCFFCADDTTLESYGIAFYNIMHEDGTGGDLTWVVFWADECAEGYGILCDSQWDDQGDLYSTEPCDETGLGEGCLWSYRRVREGDYDMAAEDLRICRYIVEGEEAGTTECSDLGPGQNSARLTLRDGDTVYFSMVLWDYDTGTMDDLWCAEEDGMDWLGGPRSAAGWASTDNPMSLPMDVTTNSLDQGDCVLELTMRGIEELP
jgi:LysM repeat protein